MEMEEKIIAEPGNISTRKSDKPGRTGPMEEMSSNHSPRQVGEVG
jgi:hypothetical protein